MPGRGKPMSKQAALKQSRRMGKRAMTSDDAYRMQAKKGGNIKKEEKNNVKIFFRKIINKSY
tara:strand:+ start:192 stop:377 length:186 start_codon:yes stop_codon:yes gene_type:complete